MVALKQCVVSISHLLNSTHLDQMTSNGTWTQLLPQFDLPEEFPFSNGTTSVSGMLAQYYRAILFPFEESYKKNMQETQRKANMANQQGNVGQNMAQRGVPGGPQGGMNNNAMTMQQRMGMNSMNQGATPSPRNMSQPPNTSQRFPMNQPPTQRPQSAMMIHPGGDTMLPVGQIPEVNLLDQDVQGIKRKLDSSELDNKRVRPRTGWLIASSHGTSEMLTVLLLSRRPRW
jgi:SWI/SNF chromatin-remodeling complex subunit SWI1